MILVCLCILKPKQQRSHIPFDNNVPNLSSKQLITDVFLDESPALMFPLRFAKFRSFLAVRHSK